jgi:hypothetical protein
VRFSLSLLILVLFHVTACAPDEGDRSPRCDLAPATSVGPGDVDGLFPLDVGRWWQYDDFRLEVVGTVVEGGQVLAVVEDRRLDGTSRGASNYYADLPSGVFLYGWGDQRGPEDLSLPELVLRWPVVEGDRYTVMDCRNLVWEGDDVFDQSVTNEVGGLEAVTTPAGTFVARKVTNLSRITIRPGPVTEDVGELGEGLQLQVLTVDTWFAPGVGIVRMHGVYQHFRNWWSPPFTRTWTKELHSYGH